MLGLLERLLGAAGLEVTTAASGEDALASALAERPDVVTLDVNLPGLSGYEVCRALREAYGASLPILFLSGSRTESFDRVAGLLLAPDELLARVRGLVRRSAPAARQSRHTSRELEVLELLAAGKTQGENATAL